ncbi:hypothetical protein GGF44_001245 [Coemansia sp. RSA 1694]|nr:hypothetical protein GGF44_001245 [Coemansia sp. RSA 1694]
MTGSDIDYLRATIDHLIVTQRLLLACTSVTEQGMQTPLDSPTNIQPSDLRMHITDDDDIIELATDMRLDEIKRDVRAKEYTWAGLREQYPPGQSGFAPLSVNANTLADIDNEDEVCSQAAAMAAYGIDLLKPALSSSQIDRMRVQKVVDLLAALCGMLVVARDKHRESAANVLIPAQDIGEDMESESADIASGQIAEVAHTQESSRCTKQRHQGFKIRGSSSSMRSHPYRRDCPRSASIVALDSRLDDTLEVASTTNQSRVQQPAKMPVGLSRQSQKPYLWSRMEMLG